MNPDGLHFEDVIKLMRERYAAPQWAFLEQVGDQTGYGTSRHADALAMGLWPSRGLELHGFEVKVSRSDWRNELRKPDKAEPIAARCDRWFVIAPAEVVPLMEIPANWGLIEVRKGKLVQTKEAARLDPLPLDRSFLAALLRRASAQNPTVQMKLDARTEARQEMMAELPAQVTYETAELRGELDRLRQRVVAFEETTGVPLEGHGLSDWGFPKGADVARAVLFLAQGGLGKLNWQIDQIDRVVEQLQKASGLGKELLASDEL